MSIFDLIFICAFAVSVTTLAVVAVAFLRGRHARGFAILRIFAICAGVYFACDVAVDSLATQRVIAVGTPWCFDEWCLTVTDAKRATAGGTDIYRIALRLSSQARRKAQRANGAWIYLIDDQSNRYAPEAIPADVALNVLLQPGEAIDASRTFRIPVDMHIAGLVTGHGGPYCGAMSILIIGAGGCLFNKPSIIRLP